MFFLHVHVASLFETLSSFLTVIPSSFLSQFLSFILQLKNIRGNSKIFGFMGILENI